MKSCVLVDTDCIPAAHLVVLVVQASAAAVVAVALVLEVVHSIHLENVDEKSGLQTKTRCWQGYRVQLLLTRTAGDWRQKTILNESLDDNKVAESVMVAVEVPASVISTGMGYECWVDLAVVAVEAEEQNQVHY